MTGAAKAAGREGEDDMIEVEIKLPVQRDLKEELLAQGFIPNVRICERDTYFDSDDGEIRSSGQAFRIRTEQNLDTGKVVSLVTFKGKRMDQTTVTRPEYETQVEDGKAFWKILEELGYHPVRPEVIKERQMLVKEDMTACLDHVHGLGDFLELEILVEEDEKEPESAGSISDNPVYPEIQAKEKALKKIEDLLGKLGYSLADTTQNSYLSQLQGRID